MENLQKRFQRMIYRIPVVVAGLVAMILAIWYLVAGKLPNTSGTILSEKMAYQLPFEVSRLWDIPMAAVFAALGVLAWYFDKKLVEDIFKELSQVTMIFVFLSGILVMIGDIGAPVGLGAFASALSGILCACKSKNGEGKDAVLSAVAISACVAFGIGCGGGISFGLAVGLWIAVALAIVYAVLAALVFGLVYMVKICGIIGWILARDIPEDSVN